MPTKDEMIWMARQAAIAHAVPPEIVLGIIERETEFNPSAMRYEPAFMAKYIAPHYIKGEFNQTEAYGRAFSWGLMQVMGQTARELGFAGEFLSELCNPEVGLEWGCMEFARRLKNANDVIEVALEAYNGGANPNYGKEVLVLAASYRTVT